MRGLSSNAGWFKSRVVKRLQSWFSTFIYSERLQARGWRQFNRELLKECRQLQEFDDEGRNWSKKNYPGGYTSYGSLDKIHHMSSTFMELGQRIQRHANRFANALDWDLGGHELSLTDCWVNIMPFRTIHSLHLHPLSVISGTYYVVTPRRCSGLKFEDPRLACFMAAPPRINDPRPPNQQFVTYPAEAGKVILFESWLRHEVPASQVQSERISISFNFNWA